MLKKLIQLIKDHKLAAFLVGFGLFLALLIIPRRVSSYLKGPAEQYETTKVRKENLLQTVSASGEIEAENQVTLKFQTSGLLAWVGVKEGDWVEKWQAIASLDKRELEKDLKKKLLAYMNERWDFEQTQDDYGVEGQPLEKVILSEAEKRILEKAQFDLESAVLDVEIKDLANKLATLVSPIEGIITNIEEPIAGVNITPATAEFTIADPSEMKFVANVDESDISEIREGQKVIISLDAYPEEELEGEVAKIAFAAITTSGGGTAFPVEILLPSNVDQRFKVGMNGDVEIILAAREETLTIPLEAIKRKEGQTYVQMIEGKEVKEVSVKTGLSSETRIEIIEGLAEDQVVIIDEKER